MSANNVKGHVAIASSSELNENADTTIDSSESQAELSFKSSLSNIMVSQTNQSRVQEGKQQALDSLVALEALLHINKMVLPSPGSTFENNGLPINQTSPSRLVPAINNGLPMNQASPSRLVPTTRYHLAPLAPTIQEQTAQIHCAPVPRNVVSAAPSFADLRVFGFPNITGQSIPINKNDQVSDSKVDSHESGDATVRKHVIEEALRSKSQRGKKRDALSEEERLELTRTRNREHAKTTRIRKKARHDELLNIEKKYSLCVSTEAMFAAKRACIDNFLKLKTFTMRKNLFASDATVSTHLLNRKASGTLPKKVSFNDEEDQRYPSSPSDGLFSEILDKAKTFKIDIISTPSSINSDVKGTGFHSLGICGMCSYDDELVKKVYDKFGQEAASNVAYIIDGVIDDVSISANAKTGFTKFKFITTFHQKQLSLFQGIMSFKFSLTSGKITEVEFWIKSNGGLSFLPSFNSSYDVENRKPYISSPERSKKKYIDEKSTHGVDGGDGPGMNI